MTVLPVMGRAVVFNTTLQSFHGQPDPVGCPPDRSRRSIATYYYTAAPDRKANAPTRTTTFQTRPAKATTSDWKVRYNISSAIGCHLACRASRVVWSASARPSNMRDEVQADPA